MKLRNIILFVLILFICSCGERKSKTEQLLHQYLSAANDHDFNVLEELISEETVWYLGGDTLVGVKAVMGPLKFDQGAETKVTTNNIKVKGDTAEFELIEMNNVLSGLGIDSLRHYARFVFSGSKIVLIEPRMPPHPLKSFQDSVMTFFGWLKSEDPAAYKKLINSEGKFQYSQENGELMAHLVGIWRKTR